MSRRFRLSDVTGPSLAACVILLACWSDLGGQLAHGTGSTEPNLKVAFIADQGSGRDAQAVLRLIRAEGAHMVLHAGDFDYDDDPAGWDAAVTSVLGADFPYFATPGNHDTDRWGGSGGYQARLQQRLQRVPGATCAGDLGVKSSCRYRGLFFILSGAGTMGSGHDSYIRQQLEADNSTWRVCVWHKNQSEMQVGGKDSDVGWGPYEACREHGAIISTGHEHSYSRTKTLVNIQRGTVDPAWPVPDRLRVAPGATFTVVSGLGGRSIRDQERCLPTTPPYGCNGEWAVIYTSDQGAQYGALFIEFHVNGDPKAARGYFKNINGEVIDRFTITAGGRLMATANRQQREQPPATVDTSVEEVRAAPPPAAAPPTPPTRSQPRMPSPSDACVVSRERWEGTSFQRQNGTFSVEFDIVPERAPINAITGLSLGRATEYDDLAASVRFSPEGVIDARNGKRFAAQTSLAYEAGAQYRVRMVVRVHERTYDVYITPPGGAEQALARRHDFRDDQDDVEALNHWAVFARDGSHQVCGFSGPGTDVRESPGD